MAGRNGTPLCYFFESPGRARTRQEEIREKTHGQRFSGSPSYLLAAETEFGFFSRLLVRFHDFTKGHTSASL